MKTSTTLRVTMEALDVRKACEEYMVKHGVVGAKSSGLNIEFTKSGKDVTATLLVELREADDTETVKPEEATESDTVQDMEDPAETTTTTQEATESTTSAEVTKTSSLFSS